MVKKSVLRKYAIVLLAFFLLVPILIFIAALIYPDYSPGYEYLSDLGRYRLSAEHGNRANWAPMIIFNSSLILMGFATILYFALRGRFGGGNLLLRIVGAVLGIVGGIGFIGIALTPHDVFPHWHNIFTFNGLILCFACFINSFCADGIFSKRSLNMVWLVFILQVGITNYTFLHQIAIDALPGSPTGQICQKLFMMAYWLYMVAQSVTLLVFTSDKSNK